MHFSSFLAATAVSPLASAAALPRGYPTKPPPPSHCPQQNATAEAMVYGLPLLAYQKTFAGTPPNASVNELFSFYRLATPADTNVVKPNDDSIYANAMIDLSHEDVLIEIGQVPEDRYWVASFYDAMGENYFNMGSVNGSQAGNYTLSLSELNNDKKHPESTCVGEIHPGNKIYAPATFGYLVVRVVVEENTPGGIEETNKYVRRFSSKPQKHSRAPRWEPVGPRLTKELFANSSSSEGEYLMDLLARCQSSIAAPATPQTSRALRLAGIDRDSNQYTRPGCVSPPTALSSAGAAIASYASSSSSSGGYLEPTSNGWVLTNPIGHYGTNYLARSIVSLWGTYAQTHDQALYPSYAGRNSGSNSSSSSPSPSSSPTESAFSLARGEAYKVTFSEKPPVNEKFGFWSMTVYNATGYLWENGIDRYSLGDRSNITYPGGSGGELVYGDDDGSGVEEKKKKKEFELLLQNEEIEKGNEWFSNWIPTPVGEFQVLLRYYAPAGGLLTDEYVYPVVEKIEAVVG